MNIKELLELDDKQTIFGTDTQINTFGTWGGANKAFIKASPEAYTKLREIVDMLPEIKDRLAILALQKLDAGYYFGGDTPEEILEKIVEWENK